MMSTYNDNPQILIVDDDQGIRELLQRYLREQGFQVATVENGVKMAEWLNANTADAIILDLMLPGEDGLSLARQLRSHSEDLPILMLSARGEEIDRIIGLEVGADDYLAKPFNPRELLARLRAILRRRKTIQPDNQHQPENTHQYHFGPYCLDVIERQLRHEGKVIELSNAEYQLLLALVRNPDLSLNRDQLVEMFQGYERDPFDRSIEVRVTRLRRKIEVDPGKPRYILTVRGVGYRFSPDGKGA